MSSEIASVIFNDLFGRVVTQQEIQAKAPWLFITLHIKYTTFVLLFEITHLNIYSLDFIYTGCLKKGSLILIAASIDQNKKKRSN